MAKQNTPRQQPNPKPSEPRHGGHKGRTTPKPPVKPKQSPSK